jgi:hypothetical protein
MVKKISINLVLLLTYFVSWVFFWKSNTTTTSQWFGMTIIFLISSILIYLNNKFRKEEKEHKWIWLFFMLSGITVLSYSSVILCLLFAFRHGVGF